MLGTRDELISDILLLSFMHGHSSMTDQQELAFISSVQTLDAVYKTYQEQWPIGVDDQRESRESTLLAYIDDDFKGFSTKLT